MRSKQVQFLFTLALALYALSPHAWAASTGLPMEAPAQKLGQACTGPMAFYTCIGAIAIGGLVWIFGHDFRQFGAGIFCIAVVGALITGATAFAQGIGWTSGAEIGTKLEYVITANTRPSDRPSTDVAPGR